MVKAAAGGEAGSRQGPAVMVFCFQQIHDEYRRYTIRGNTKKGGWCMIFRESRLIYLSSVQTSSVFVSLCRVPSGGSGGNGGSGGSDGSDGRDGSGRDGRDGRQTNG